MLITNKQELTKYTEKYRVWQGIPSVECTKKGRIFVTHYSGGKEEEIRNYCILSMSDDGGETFQSPVAVATQQGVRYFDPNLWIDPLGRLWFTFTRTNNGEYDCCATVCDNPDADELVFSEIRRIGDGVMMQKPIVLSTGEWLFPIAKWKGGVSGGGVKWKDGPLEDRKAFVYKTVDNGKTFERLGGVDAWNRSFDEHNIYERQDGSLRMLIRTHYGIAESYSYDGGNNWCEADNSGIVGADARFYIGRLSSGKVLLVNHARNKRLDMTAYLSDDDGKTWKWKLLLDPRCVSYPDVKEENGVLYIVYDRERGGYVKKLEDNYKYAREILLTKITEADIMAGKLVSEGSEISRVISRLGVYEGEEDLFYNLDSWNLEDEADFFINTYSKQELAMQIYVKYPPCCFLTPEPDKVDGKISAVDSATDEKSLKNAVVGLLSVLRANYSRETEEHPVVELAKTMIDENLTEEKSLEDLSLSLNVSKFYLSHLFKKCTGTTIPEYKNARKMQEAKKLLILTDKAIAEIAFECGFSTASYFSEQFLKAEKITPSDYRKLHKR